jgi:hypothetical protein
LGHKRLAVARGLVWPVDSLEVLALSRLG